MDKDTLEAPSRRTLTDADIEKIATVLEARLAKKFYHDLGKGLWGFVWKSLMAFLLFLAANGVHDKWWKL